MYHFSGFRSPLHNVATTPPGPAPPTPTGYFSSSPSYSPTSNGPQDVNLEPTGSIPFSFGLRSPGKTSPFRGRNLKEYEDQFDHLQKENIKLKLRIYFLEEKIGYKGIKEDKVELHKANIELKVETESLKKQLCDKQELVRQAASLLTNLENQFKEQLQAVQEKHERETQQLKSTIVSLQKDLEDYAEKVQQESAGDLTQLCGLAFSSTPDDVNLGKAHLKEPRLQGIFSIQEPLEPDEQRSSHYKNLAPNSHNEVIPESAKKKIQELEEEVERLTTKVQDLQSTLKDKERTSNALQEDIDNLKKEIEERDDKVSDLEQEVTEKDQKVDQLMQELETRHLEIEAKDSTIQTLHEDLNKVEPQIEVKVQECMEKDRIIEEKKEQLQQQNKILVEIQITLDEKQKQIAELEESLSDARIKVEKLNKDYDFSLRTIKEMAAEVLTRDKEIIQLKKELKKKEKKIKDLLAELKEALDMLQKAKWEAETNGGGQDGVKEMVEEENERLWAELEQRKLEIMHIREEKEKFAQEMKNNDRMLRKEKEDAEEQLKLLQKQMAAENRGERDKSCAVEQTPLVEKKEAREGLLKSQEVIIEALKSDLLSARGELSERKEELKDLKRELSSRNNDIQEFFSKELFGRNKELHELQNKICSMPMGQENPLEALKLFLEANQMKLNPNLKEAKESQQQVQVRSNSLSKLTEPLAKPSGKENTPSQQTPKAGRSNSFSLLENLLYANMGQKVYNTNQTFNTYVLSSDAEGKPGEVIPLNESASPNPSAGFAVEMDNQEDIKNKVLLASLLCRDAQRMTGKNPPTGVKGMRPPTSGKGEAEVEICSIPEAHTTNERDFELLYGEVINIRNETQALRKDRELLKEQVNALQVLNEQLTHAPHSGHERDSRNRSVEKEAVEEIRNEMETLKSDLNGTKHQVTLQMLQVASNKYQESLKNYKQEIISLRKRLTDSHNACDLLRNRLEELVDFFEQILEMDQKGIINLSYLSSAQRCSLRKSLEDSRSLSLSLSHSLMIGTDSVLGESIVSQNDEEASRFCLSFNNLADTVDMSQLNTTAAGDALNYSELCGPEVVNDFLYYAFAAQINSQMNEKAKEIDNLSSKLNHLLAIKDDKINTEAHNVKSLQNQINELKEELHLKNQLLIESQTGFSKSAAQLSRSSAPSIEIENSTNSSLHLSALESSMAPNIDPNIHEGFFIVPGESSSSDTLPPPPHVTSQDERGTFVSANKARVFPSDIGSAYSTDVVVKSLPNREHEVLTKPVPNSHHEPCLQGATLEEPALPPTFALASPSESEAWSEPDRNVSLARIGLETCNLVSISHDRSLSRSRMTRSAPFTSESEGEGNVEEVKEGSVGLSNTSIKPKRRSDAAEVKRLTAKLKSVEQLNETLRAELHIYQTLNQQFNSDKKRELNYAIDEFPFKSTVEEKYFHKAVNDPEENNSSMDNENKSFPLLPSLLQEIRSLRMKLEEAIDNNDLLRDQLEAALSGYLSEESRNLTTRVASMQQEVKNNQEKLLIVANTEHQLKMQVKDYETKMFELGERLADYLTTNQKLEQKISEVGQDLQKSRETLSNTERELQDLRSIREEKELAEKELQYSKTLQMEVDINTLKIEIRKLQLSEKDKDRKVEEQRKYIVDLEESKADCELKLAEKNSAIKNLYQSISTLQKESSKSSDAEHLLPELQKALQNKEERLLQVTKERFALVGETARLQAQLSSVTTQVNLLQREVRELSVSEDKTGSSNGVEEITQKLQSAQATIKELLQSQEMHRSEKQATQKELELMQEEISALRAHLDHVLSREAVSNSRETRELQVSYSTLEARYQNVLSEKNSLDNRLKEVVEKEMRQLKASLSEKEAKKDELTSQLESERCLTKNLQFQIKNLQLNSSHSKVPSDHELQMSNAASTNLIRPKDTMSPTKINASPFKESSWIENKENRFPHYNTPRGTLSLPNIEDDVTSGDSPDLGIGSDGQFSSLERLTSNTSVRVLKGGVNPRFYTIESEKEERRSKLCSDPSHSRLFSENERLRDEKEELLSKLGSSKESLEDALTRLSKANQKKESVERAICKQLSKTHDVLKQAKGNLRHAKPQKSLPQQNLPTNNQP